MNHSSEYPVPSAMSKPLNSIESTKARNKIVSLFVKSYSIPFFIYFILLPIKIIQYWEYINDPRFPILGMKYIWVGAISVILILFEYSLIGLGLGRFASKHLLEPWSKLYIKIIAVSALITMALPFSIHAIIRSLRPFLAMPQVDDFFYIKLFMCCWPIFIFLNFTLFFISKRTSERGPNQSFNPDPAATGT